MKPLAPNVPMSVEPSSDAVLPSACTSANLQLCATAMSANGSLSTRNPLEDQSFINHLIDKIIAPGRRT